MFDLTSARGIQREKQRQARPVTTVDHGGEKELHFPWKGAAIAVAAGVLVTSLLAISSSGRTFGSAVGPPDFNTSDARIIDDQSHVENGVDDSPWWEGRTWAGEIDTCVAATADAPGCEWLAGKLIHRRCELKTYQTFAAALAVGATFDVLHQEAVNEGDCRGGSETPVGGRDEPLRQE